LAGSLLVGPAGWPGEGGLGWPPARFTLGRLAVVTRALPGASRGVARLRGAATRRAPPPRPGAAVAPPTEARRGCGAGLARPRAAAANPAAAAAAVEAGDMGIRACPCVEAGGFFDGEGTALPHGRRFSTGVPARPGLGEDGGLERPGEACASAGRTAPGGIEARRCWPYPDERTAGFCIAGLGDVRVGVAFPFAAEAREAPVGVGTRTPKPPRRSEGWGLSRDFSELRAELPPRERRRAALACSCADGAGAATGSRDLFVGGASGGARDSLGYSF